MSQKRDLNYIARVEKAISEEWGEDTVANPKKGWDDAKEGDYLEQIKILSERDRRYQERSETVNTEDGFLLTKKLLNKESNRTCPVCEKYSFNSRDDVYMTKFSCCYRCFIQHVDGREERWSDGWRPNLGENKNG